MADEMSAPNHYEIRTPLALRAWSFVGAMLALNAVVIALYVALFSPLFTVVSQSTPNNAAPWWSTPIVFLVVFPLLVPAFIRIHFNKRNHTRAIRTHLDRRAADDNAPDRRVFWRHDELGAARGPGLANPYWSPVETVGTVEDDGREIRPAPRWPSRKAAKRALLLAIGAGAGVAAVFNFAGLSPYVFAPIVALLVAIGAALRDAPAPLAQTRLQAWRTGITIGEKRFRWEKTDLILIGAHEQTARCLLHVRETGRLIPCWVHADDATLLAQRAANDTTAAAPALTTPTVTMPTSIAIDHDARVPTQPPPCAHRVVLTALPVGGIIFSIGMVVGVMPMLSNALSSSGAVPSTNPLNTLLIVALAAALVGSLIAATWRHFALARFERDMDRHTFEPATITRPAKAPVGVGTLLRWSPAEVPQHAEPVYEETVFTPNLRWYQNPIVNAVALLPFVAMMSFQGGAFNAAEFARYFVMLGVATCTIGIAAVPAITIRALKGRHPRADATAIEFPGKGDAVERYEWSTSALVVLGEWAGATRLRVLDTTNDRHTDFTIPARSLPDLLGAVAAYRKDHTEKTTDDDA